MHRLLQERRPNVLWPWQLYSVGRSHQMGTGSRPKESQLKSAIMHPYRRQGGNTPAESVPSKRKSRKPLVETGRPGRFFGTLRYNVPAHAQFSDVSVSVPGNLPWLLNFVIFFSIFLRASVPGNLPWLLNYRVGFKECRLVSVPGNLPRSLNLGTCL